MKKINLACMAHIFRCVTKLNIMLTTAGSPYGMDRQRARKGLAQPQAWHTGDVSGEQYLQCEAGRRANRSSTHAVTQAFERTHTHESIWRKHVVSVVPISQDIIDLLVFPLQSGRIQFSWLVQGYSDFLTVAIENKSLQMFQWLITYCNFPSDELHECFEVLTACFALYVSTLLRFVFSNASCCDGRVSAGSDAVLD